MKSVRHSFLTLVLLAVIAVAPATADSSKTIFYNVTTDESWSAGMALGQANMALGAGYKVVIFLNVRAVFLASKTFATDTFSGSGHNLQDMLKMAMSKGATVIICPMCMQKVGMTMDNAIDGIVRGGPDVTMKAMTADNTVVISY